MKSHKARTTPPWARELIEREDEIEAYARALFGPSHAKYREWRAAKGLKEPAKKRGRPSELHEGERNLLKGRKPGQTIQEAVSYFLRTLEKGKRIDHRSLKSSVSRALQEGKRIDPQVIVSLRQPPRGPITPAVVDKALRAYYRHHRQKRLS